MPSAGGQPARRRLAAHPAAIHKPRHAAPLRPAQHDHYILSHIQALDKSLSFFSAGGGACTSPSTTSRLLAAPCCHFDHARTAAQTAIAHVAEVAAYRLIFYA